MGEALLVREDWGRAGWLCPIPHLTETESQTPEGMPLPRAPCTIHSRLSGPGPPSESRLSPGNDLLPRQLLVQFSWKLVVARKNLDGVIGGL